jgi:ferrous iron transport protein B
MARATERKKLILVGNPNVGKSVIFRRLTGRFALVSNYPGTTVEISRGELRLGSVVYEVVDTPGVTSLVPQSEDERVTCELLLREAPDVIVQVADAKNIRRTLLLTCHLAELGVPMVLVLNMIDEMYDRGIDIDSDAVSRLFGIPVVETIATYGHGLRHLLRAIPRAAVPHLQWVEENSLRDIFGPLRQSTGLPLPLAVEWLEAGDVGFVRSVEQWIGSPQTERVKEAMACHHCAFHRHLCREIVRHRENFLNRAVAMVKRNHAEAKLQTDSTRRRRHQVTSILGRLTRQPLTGIPILIGVLWVMYEFVGRLGAQVLVDLLENGLFGRYLIPWAERLIPAGGLADLLLGRYGLLSMGLTYAIAIILPVVTTFFFAFGVLEDSGYLPRLAILSDRLLRTMGLTGKAILPLILGLGCDTMATLTTRILPSAKERVIATLLLALGVPCSAQLGVILGMASSFTPAAAVTVLVVVASQLVLVGSLASKVIPGHRGDFIFEIPPIRRPLLTNVLAKTWYRLKWFLGEVVPLFLLATFVLFVLDRVSVGGQSGIGWIEAALRPLVVGWLDLPAEAATAFIMGFLRRDYGAAGLFDLARRGQVTTQQAIVSLVVITLFVPCLANFLVIIKEHGWKRALSIVGFIVPFAFLIGGLVNWVLRAFHLFAA